MDIESGFLRGLGWAKKQSAWGERMNPEAMLAAIGPGWPVIRGDVYVVFMVALQIYSRQGLFYRVHPLLGKKASGTGYLFDEKGKKTGKTVPVPADE